METTGTRSRRAPYGNQSYQIQVSSRWVTVIGPGEAQVATGFTKSK